MSDLLTALLSAMALWGLGGAIALALLPQALQRWWFVVGLSPLMAFGTFFAISSVASVVDLDVTAPLTAGVMFLLVSVGLIVRRQAICWSCLRPTRPELLDILALAAISALSLYALWSAKGSSLILPNYDAQNHGLFVRRILEEATLDPSQIVVRDPVTDVAMAQYYPLSLHLFAAYVVRFGTVSIPTALFGATTLVVAIAWPVGMYCLTKVAVAWRWAPVIAAAFASTALQFPYKPISWSGLTTLAGLSLVPVVVAITLVMFRDLDTTAVPAVGFSLGALFVLHNPQALAAAVLALAFGARFLWRRELARFLSVRAALTFLVAFLVPTITILPRLVGGAQERSDLTVTYFGEIAGLVGQLLTLSVSSPRSTILPLVFVLAGTAVAFATRSGRSVVFAYVVIAGLVTVAGLDQWWTAPFHLFVSPWYGHAERVAYNLVIPVSILGAIAICGGRQLLASQLAKVQSVRFRRVLSASVVAATIGVVVVTSLGSAKNLNAASKQDFAYFQVLDRSILDEAQSLADEAGRPIRILASSASGGMWLYVLDPRLEMLGSFTAGGDLQVALDELIVRLPQADTDPWVNEMLNRYGVDFVFTNGWGYNGAPSTPSEADLEANPCFELVAQVGNDRIWSVCGPRSSTETWSD